MLLKFGRSGGHLNYKEFMDEEWFPQVLHIACDLLLCMDETRGKEGKRILSSNVQRSGSVCKSVKVKQIFQMLDRHSYYLS